MCDEDIFKNTYTTNDVSLLLINIPGLEMVPVHSAWNHSELGIPSDNDHHPNDELYQCCIKQTGLKERNITDETNIKTGHSQR